VASKASAQHDNDSRVVIFGGGIPIKVDGVVIGPSERAAAVLKQDVAVAACGGRRSLTPSAGAILFSPGMVRQSLEDMHMIRVAIVTGSTRPNRNNEAVAKWVSS